ncbi:conjugative transfer relaxase/helicase TraI [Vibrio cincinnatiensis]|uniref:conjugative transfer relaxase/helicase TraI n=1 Tax=Vibrio cincinnatiensis TaxID=675 RepID=UPI001EE04DB5|nr:conjugative transfer relaxase/helicase TraI [Vibrio cincinnatiensis]MCG3741177.1 conjugative transfer relaxase/helicase TraI [Vibrio cincinnatiensis]
MMSITPIKSASNAAQYYLGEENKQELPDVSLEKSGENYYLREKSQEENTFWHGSLAKDAGLEGLPIDEKTLEEVLSGKLGDETIQGKRDNHKSGFDLTFSAPKSVSILALVGGDSRLIDAHNEAVKFALSELEKDAAQAKVTNEKGIQSFENTHSMLFGVVRHKTSRTNDAQLHSHALAANMTRDKEGNLRALASCLKQKGGVINGTSERIYNYQKYYTALYQSQLAKIATDKLGFQVRGVGNGQFEIDGVPQSLIDTFSTRKHQIDQKTLDLGYNSQATRDIAAKNTRPEKSYLSDATLNQAWQEKAKNEDFDIKSFIVQSMTNPTKEQQVASKNIIAQEAVTRAVEHLGQYSTSISIEKLVEKAVEDFTKGEQANALDIKQEVEKWIKEGHLIPLEQKGQFTTKSMIENEKILMEVTQGRASNMRIRPDDTTLSKLNLSLDRQQKIRDICESTKQFQVVNVFGQSKQIAESLLNIGNHSGKRVHFVSQTSKENQIGKNDITRKNHTISAWISQLFTEDKRHTLQGFLNTDTPLTNKDFILVDNAGKMSASELIDITIKAKESQSKVVFLNRASSQQGFKAHNAINLYSKGNVVTTDWVNNKTVDTKIVINDQDQQKVASTYARIPDKENVQVLTTSSVDQKRMTESIRQTLKNEGQLSHSGVSIDTQIPHYLSKSEREISKHYQSGMTLRHWESGKPQDYIITKKNTGSNTLQAMSKIDGKLIEFNPSSSQFKSMNMQIFKPERLEIGLGERLVAKDHHKVSGLTKDSAYVVSDLTDSHITMTDNEGNSKSITLESLRDSPLQYNYVRLSSQAESKNYSMLYSKSFALSKELMHDLSEKSQRIDIFTENKEKAQNVIEKSEYRPSAVERVMYASESVTNDRMLSNSTFSSIKNDVEKSLSILSSKGNEPVIEKAVSFALNHISEREAGFTQKELVVEALRYAFEEKGQALSKEEIEKELSKRSDTLSAEFSDGTRWTTQAALDTEKQILSNIEKGKDQHTPYARSDQVYAFLATKPNMTTGQKDSIHLISTSKDSFVGIQGLAGVGKSTMLESNIELIQSIKQMNHEQAQNVIGLAPTHAAVSELESKGVKAQTLESLLSEIRNGSKIPENYKNTLFFLDESSMVNNKQALEFTDLVLNSQSKAVLLGDKEQLLSLNAGKPFELAMKQGVIATAHMTDIVRQQNKTLLGGVHNILDKQPESALEKLKSQEAIDPKQTEHVISTLDESIKDRAQAAKVAQSKLYWSVAKDYLERTKEARENTLIIAYTNQERDEITSHIRIGLADNKEIGKENIMSYRLRSIGASREELATMLPYQKGLVISTKPGRYGTIEHVDKENGIVKIKSTDTGKESFFLPMHRDHKFTALFSSSQMPISSGDKIVTRFTDKSRDIKANVEYVISSARNNEIIAKSKDGQMLSIDPNQLKDGHWDYAYTRTADMAQGSTYKNVITAIKGSGSLTNLRRAYIDVTRASQHIRLYTDNPKNMMKSWLSKEVHKQSAIETLEKTAPVNTTYFNDNALPKEDIRFQNKNGDFDWKIFRDHINKELPRFTESLATSMLGKPNASKSSRDYLVFGTGKTATTVSLTGEYRGYFKDYTTGEKGSLINLMMSHKDISYKDALFEANKIINDPESYGLSANLNHDKLSSSQPKHIAQYEQRAKDYLINSKSNKGTLVETYLNKLGINEVENNNVRFHDGVYSSEDKSVHPAMIVNIHNSKGETRAIEITYLNSIGEKDLSLNVNPRTLGTKSKHFTEFNQGENLNTTIISTSIENSFLINQETKGHYDIINVNHKNDIQNIPTEELRQNIIIVLDRENININPNNIEKTLQNFENRNIQFITDNDITKEIKSCIEKFENKDIETIKSDDFWKEEPYKNDLETNKLDYVKNQSDSVELDFNDKNIDKVQYDLDLSNEFNPSEKELDLEREIER